MLPLAGCAASQARIDEVFQATAQLNAAARAAALQRELDGLHAPAVHEFLDLRASAPTGDCRPHVPGVTAEAPPPLDARGWKRGDAWPTFDSRIYLETDAHERFTVVCGDYKITRENQTPLNATAEDGSSVLLLPVGVPEDESSQTVAATDALHVYFLKPVLRIVQSTPLNVGSNGCRGLYGIRFSEPRAKFWVLPNRTAQDVVTRELVYAGAGIDVTRNCSGIPQ